MLLVYSAHYAFGVFFTPMSSEFGWNRAATSGAFSLSWIIQGILSVFMGWLCDRLGPRVVLSISGLLVGLGFILMFQIHSLWEFYLYYGVVLGAGLSGVVVPLFANIARWFTARRSTMTGLAANGVAGGVTVGTLIADSLILRFEWRLSYLILGAAVLVIVVLAAQWLKQPSVQAQEHSTLSVSNGLSLRQAVRTRQFWMLYIIFFCLAFGTFVIMVHLVPHLLDAGLSSTSATRVMAVLGILNIAGCIFVAFSGKLGTKVLYPLGLILMTIPLFSLLLFKDLMAIYLVAGAFGLGVAILCSSQPLLIANMFGVKAHGVIFGLANNGFTIGATLGPTIAGYLFDSTSSYSNAFLISVLLAFIETSKTYLFSWPRKVLFSVTIGLIII